MFMVSVFLVCCSRGSRLPAASRHPTKPNASSNALANCYSCSNADFHPGSAPESFSNGNPRSNAKLHSNPCSDPYIYPDTIPNFNAEADPNSFNTDTGANCVGNARSACYSNRGCLYQPR